MNMMAGRSRFSVLVLFLIEFEERGKILQKRTTNPSAAHGDLTSIK